MMEMELNRRQMLAWEYAGRNGSITSKELMDILDGSISKRTASYDIQDLVNRGLLTKVGRGPATRADGSEEVRMRRDHAGLFGRSSLPHHGTDWAWPLDMGNRP